MIETMSEFKKVFQEVRQTGNVFSVVDVLEVMELRLRRIEQHIGMPMPDRLNLVRKVVNDRSGVSCCQGSAGREQLNKQ